MISNWKIVYENLQNQQKNFSVNNQADNQETRLFAIRGLVAMTLPSLPSFLHVTSIFYHFLASASLYPDIWLHDHWEKDMSKFCGIASPYSLTDSNFWISHEKKKWSGIKRLVVLKVAIILITFDLTDRWWFHKWFEQPFDTYQYLCNFIQKHEIYIYIYIYINDKNV